MNKIEFINLRNKKKWQNLINYNEINPDKPGNIPSLNC